MDLRLHLPLFPEDRLRLGNPVGLIVAQDLLVCLQAIVIKGRFEPFLPRTGCPKGQCSSQVLSARESEGEVSCFGIGWKTWMLRFPPWSLSQKAQESPRLVDRKTQTLSLCSSDFLLNP